MVADSRVEHPRPAALAAFLAGCEAVVLVATEVEAAPLLGALSHTRDVALAGVRLAAGVLPQPDKEPRAPSGRPDSEVGRWVVVAVSGCDKVNAAHALTWLLVSMEPPPRLVVQVGVAGALPAPSAKAGAVGPLGAAAVGDVVVATQEAYSDTGSSSPAGWLSARELGLPIATLAGEETGGVFPMDAALVKAAVAAITRAGAAAATGVAPPAGTALGQEPRVVAGLCVTSSQMTGTDAEAQALADRWNALAESMEGAAAAHVCALHGVPFLEMRGISNLVTDRDRGSWQVETASAASARAALAVLEALDELPLPGAAG